MDSSASRSPHPRGSWRRRLLCSDAVFCLALAAGMVACRLVFFDYEMFFELHYLLLLKKNALEGITLDPAALLCRTNQGREEMP